jgi:hypothetical protein
MSILTPHRKTPAEVEREKIVKIDERIDRMRKQYNVAIGAGEPELARQHASEIDRLLELRLERPWLGKRQSGGGL